MNKPVVTRIKPYLGPSFTPVAVEVVWWPTGGETEAFREAVLRERSYANIELPEELGIHVEHGWNHSFHAAEYDGDVYVAVYAWKRGPKLKEKIERVSKLVAARIDELRRAHQAGPKFDSARRRFELRELVRRGD